MADNGSHGPTVQLLSSTDLATHSVAQDYTRKLMEASSGFNRTKETTP